MTILTLCLGAIMLITIPMEIVVVHSVVSGWTRRGGKVGIRIAETNASDEAWLAGHRAAYALRWNGAVDGGGPRDRGDGAQLVVPLGPV